MAEVLPVLAPHSLSPSASAITKLVASVSAEAEAFSKRDLPELKDTYIWVDGVQFVARLGSVRLGEPSVCFKLLKASAGC